MMRFALGLLLSVALVASAHADRIGPAGGSGLQPSGNASLTTVLATGSTTARTLAARTSERINIRDYGALGDAVSTTTAVTTSGASVTTTAGMFSASNVGEIISITGAGAAGVTYSGTVASYTSATSITVTPSPTTTLTASSQTVTVGHDDSGALAAAVGVMMSRWSVGAMPCVYAPAGTYDIRATTSPLMTGPGCVLGDGVLHTVFKMDPAYTGDLLSFSEAWPGGNFPFGGTTPGVINTLYGGPRLDGFSIWGDRSTPQTQNGIMFYDRTQFLQMQDVDVEFVKGRGFAAGLTKNQPQAFLQESRISRVRLFNDGSATSPVSEINAAGTNGQEGGGEVAIDTFDIYAPYGTGFVIRNAAVTPLTSIRFSKLRIEGLENNAPGIAADLLTIGDGTQTGVVHDITFRQTELLNPYASYAAMRLTAPAAASMPYNIDMDGVIGGGNGAGKGLVINAGRALNFNFSDILTTDTEVTVGASPLVGSQIFLNGSGGRANSWTYSVDPTTVGVIQTLPIRVGNPGSASSLGFVLNYHDGSTSGGSAIGSGAIDMQTVRNATFQVAAGNNSILIGGLNNSTSGGGSTVINGTGTAMTGIYSSAIGAINGGDRGRIASQVFASGNAQMFVVASSQAARQSMYASGTAAMRLTANAQAANSATNPIFNIPNNTAYNLSIRLVAIDRTTPANSYHWTAPMVALTRQGSVGTTALTLGTGSMAPGSLAIGSAAATVSATADTTNGGLNLTFTPPAGTDTWDAFADVVSAEVQ